MGFLPEIAIIKQEPVFYQIIIIIRNLIPLYKIYLMIKNLENKDRRIEKIKI